MPQFRVVSLTSAAALTALLTGCATAPAPETAPALTTPTPAELNIPEPEVDASCNCDDPAPAAVENHFDRGVRALAARDYARARVYFERHGDMDEEQFQREAEVGIAFVSLLQASADDGRSENGASGVDERAEMMILAMAAIEMLESQLATLAEQNEVLVADLEKREEALKRLRDLTLGQPEG